VKLETPADVWSKEAAEVFPAERLSIHQDAWRAVLGRTDVFLQVAADVVTDRVPTTQLVPLQVRSSDSCPHLGLDTLHQSAGIVDMAAVDLQTEASGAHRTQLFGERHHAPGPPHQAVADEVAPTVGTDHDLRWGWLRQQRPARDGGSGSSGQPVTAAKRQSAQRSQRGWPSSMMPLPAVRQSEQRPRSAISLRSGYPRREAMLLPCTA
jgi:hypothetical protein